jgi:hypothetical protein
MAAGGSDEEEHHWPGFVDALTVMTMVLTFIMMILGLVVFSLSQNTARSQLAEIAAAAKVDVGAGPIQQVQQKLIEALKLKAETKPTKEAKAPDTSEAEAAKDKDKDRGAPPSFAADKKIASLEKTPEAPPGAVRVTGGQDALTMVFEDRGFQLDAAASGEIKSFTEAGAARMPTGLYDVRAFAKTGLGSVSEARKLAYYRGMLVRQELVRSGISGDRIRVRVEDAGLAETENVVKIFVN